jgi:hypothetical protein
MSSYVEHEVDAESREELDQTETQERFGLARIATDPNDLEATAPSEHESKLVLERR